MGEKYHYYIFEFFKFVSFEKYDIFSVKLNDILSNLSIKQKEIILSLALSYFIADLCSKIKDDKENFLLSLVIFVIEGCEISEDYDFKISEEKFFEVVDKLSILFEDMEIINIIFYIFRYINDKRLTLNIFYFIRSLFDFIEKYDVYDSNYIFDKLKNYISFNA
ncbi:MAG: hypothetical protein RMJ67_05950 [Elusimicrobiota bacterium]|nr:hypothetical protein [Endomicrobiia bacterium]MDW8166035.1 hypothetical protein [Elusimicrobiota bacterium]